MSDFELKVSLHHKQRRLIKDRIATLVQSKHDTIDGLTGWLWDQASFANNVWVDPVSFTLMLLPAPLDTAWQGTGTGIYTRLQKSDYTLITSAKWVEDNKNNGAAKYLRCIDSTLNEKVITTATYGKNRGFYISWFGANWGDDNFIQLECGWSDTGDATEGVALRFYSSGSVEVWRNGIKEQTYSFSGDSDRQTAVEFVSVLLIPFRKKQLLVYNNMGNSFIHTFEGLDEEAQDPIITPDEKFWWIVPSGQAEVEVSPLQYASSGFCAGIKTIFGEAPLLDETPLFSSFFDGPGIGTQTVTPSLREVDDFDTVFVPDGEKRECYVRADLAGDNTTTPFVYGIHAAYPGSFDFTDDIEEENITPYLLGVGTSFAQNPGSVRPRLTLHRPDVWDENVKFRISNQPVKFEFNDLMYIDGVTEPIDWQESISDVTRVVNIPCRDQYKVFEDYQFSDDIPLDNLDLKEAFEQIYEIVIGDREDSDIQEFNYTLPSGGPNAELGWNILIKAGDTASHWLERLRDTYAPLHNMGWVPSFTRPKFSIKDNIELGNEPKVILHHNILDSIAYFVSRGETSADARRLAHRAVYRTFDEEVIAPEANDLWVVGRDRRTLRPIIVHKPDKKSIDCTIPPSMQPKNWVGTLRKYSWIDTSLTNEDVAIRTIDLLFNRLTRRRSVIEITSEFLIDLDSNVPLWVGDVVTLQSIGNWRIIGSTGAIELEPDSALGKLGFWRPTNYTLEKLEIDLVLGENPATGGNGFSTSVQEMREFSLASLNQKIFGPDRDNYKDFSVPIVLNRLA